MNFLIHTMIFAVVGSPLPTSFVFIFPNAPVLRFAFRVCAVPFRLLRSFTIFPSLTYSLT